MISEKKTYKVLLLEDNPNDKDLIQYELTKKLNLNLVFEWTIKKQDFILSLKNFNPDIVLSDYNLPDFNGFEALEITLAHDKFLPFMLITGTLNEEFAAESIKRGAWDYIVKERLNRLPGVFQNVLKQKIERQKIHKAKSELKIFQEKKSIQLKLLWDAIANAPNSVEITSKDGTIQYVNSRFEKTTGYSSEEAIGQNPNILKSGEHKRSFYKEMWETLLDGKEWNGELINRRKNGEMYWDETSISPIADPEGNIQYFVALKNDITERKKAEEELEESRRIFETLTKVSQVGIFRTNAEGETTYVNPKWSELSGLSFEEAMGDGWVQAVHPDDRQKMVENWKNGKSQNAEYRFQKSDGSIVWVIGCAAPEIKNDEIIGYIGTLTDITDRKQFEKQLEDTKTKFQKLVEDISDVLFEVDDKLCISYISPVIFKITGFPADYYIGKQLADIIYQEDMPEVLERFQELISSGFSFPVEYRTFNSEGNLIWFRSSSSPIINNNKFLGIRGIAINISNQKETEKKLLEAKERAEASDKLKTAFMNNISHEIRTPLNGIIGFAQMISEPDLSEDEKQIYFEILNASSKRLIQTVTNFMDISLITSKNVEISKRNFVPGKVLTELRMEYDPICKMTGIKLLTAIQPEITTLRVYSDEDLLSKIFKQLLNNAIKFTEKGSITIGAGIEDQNLKFSIKDTGIGITYEAQQIIFDRFIQEEETATRKHEGSGLGLTIVSGLVDLLGGTVWIESEKDKGSTFSFTIPYETGII